MPETELSVISIGGALSRFRDHSFDSNDSKQ